MKKKELYSFLSNILLFVIGALIFIFCDNLKLGLCVLFAFNALFKFMNLFNMNNKDYEDLFGCILTVIAFIMLFYFDLIIKNVILIFLIWLGLMSLVKLKKADYYHDRKDNMWIFKIFSLFIILSLGLIISLNLQTNDVNIKLFAIFFMFNSSIDAIEPLLIYLRNNYASNK